MAGKRRLEDLAHLPTDELWQIFNHGRTPDFEKLKGWEFRGWNVPVFAKLIGIQKFQKGFFVKEGKLPFGYNIPQKQNGAEQPWQSKPANDNPKRFGFYSVKKVESGGVEDKHPHALILNYGDGKNSLFEGAFLRDYVVQADPDNDDLYLGAAYIALGSARIFSNFFIIERLRQPEFKG